MNGQYGVNIGSKILILIFSLAALVGAGFSFYHAFNTATGAVIFLFLGLVLLIVAIIFYQVTVRTRVTVDDDGITLQTLVSTRLVRWADIDGYRSGDKDAFDIIPKEGKRLMIPTSIGQRKELIEWIKEKYEDVDLREREAETEAFLEDERFGASPDERMAALEMAKKVSVTTTVVAIALLGWALFSAQPFELVMSLLFIVPWIGVFLVWRYKGLMRLFPSKRSPYPSVLFLMILPVLGALTRGLVYKLYDFPSSAWAWIVLGSILVSVLVAGAFRAALGPLVNRKVMGCILVVAAVYSGSLLVYSNCYYDISTPEVWHVPVTGKHVSHGKTTTYYVQLAPWGKYESDKDVTVNSTFYSAVNIQDTVEVFLNKGRWGIPWYQVVRHDR